MSLEFDSESHIYKWNGVEVPSVSSILRETGQSKDWKDVPPYYRDRGIAVHSAVHLYLEGTLDESSLDPVIVPFFEQFKAWDKDQPLYTPITEKPYYCQRLRYAGTPDLLCNGVIWDIKCSKKLDKASEFQYRCQGSAYKTLLLEDIGMTYPFKILLLSGDGKAQIIPLDAPCGLWEHVMGIYDFKKRGSAC